MRLLAGTLRSLTSERTIIRSSWNICLKFLKNGSLMMIVIETMPVTPVTKMAEFFMLVAVTECMKIDVLGILKCSMLARAYLMTLYIIFAIHNFHHSQKKTVDCFMATRESFSFSKGYFIYCTCIWYLINFSISSQSITIFHVSLSSIDLLFLPYHMCFFLNIYQGFSLQQFSSNILNIQKLLFF